MKKIVFSVFILLAAFLTQGSAKAEELVTDLSEHIVAIKSNFTGTELLLFGAIETNSKESRALERDIVVVVRGPSENITVRKKEKISGIWMNARSSAYKNVPGFYSVASTKPLSLIASPSVLERNQIGTKNIRFRPVNTNDSDANKETIEALVRIKSDKKLYSESSGGVSFLGDTLFRANLDIPATVPVGVYVAEVFLFRDGNVIHAQSTPLYVNKSGLERLIYSFAHRHSFYYGLLAVTLALIAGWIAAVLFRKN